MQSGRGGMGMRNHGKSGWKHGSGKSPKLRLHERMEAERQERKPRKHGPMYGSIQEAFEKERKR